MGKIQNNFLKATVNKDLDERLTPNGQMTDATNVMVISEDAGNVGVLKNVKGNLKVTNTGIIGAETIGSIADDSNERCFYFVKGTDYDYIFEYNTETDDLDVVLQSSVGGVLNFSVDHRVTHSDIFISVEGESLLSWTDGYNPPRIINIEKAKAYPVDGFTELEISVMKPSPIFHPTITQVQSVADDFAGFIRDKFLTFAYRYRYEDGYYSAFSSWSPYAFIPGSFAVDLDTSTNLAMQNIARAYSIGFNTGPRSVKDVELVFKVSNSNNVYSIIKFNKEEEGWSDSTNQTFLFENYKVYNVLSESEFFRSFDNVPLKAFAQTKAGNRLVYGNYIEGRDIDSKIDFSVDYESTSIGNLQVEDFDSEVYVEGIEPRIDFWKEASTDDVIIINSGSGISMDYTNNVCTITNSTGSVKYLKIIIKTTKEPTYLDTEFNLRIYSDAGPGYATYIVPAGTLESTINFGAGAGYQILNGSSVSFYFESYSEEPSLFKTQATFRLVDSGGYTTSQIGFNTNDYYQLAYNVDNIVEKKVCNIDLSSIELTSGTQLSFDFDLRTYFEPNLIILSPENSSRYTFIYDLIETYSSVGDFISSSSFLSQMDTFFQNALSFSESNIAGATVVSIESIITSFNSTTNILTLRIPNRVIEIEEPGSGVVETKNDFVFCEFININYSSGTLFTSLHSSRDYEVGIVFLDNEGRKTTVFDSSNNTVYILPENSITQNIINVTTIGTPPSWAKYYKFAVKYNRGKYETIFTKKIYNVSQYTYLELVGDNKDKVKEGDYLVVKSDLNGVVSDYQKVKVLEAKFYDKEEITTGSESGFFFKVKAGAFNLQLEDDDLLEYIGTRFERLYPRYQESKPIVDNNGDPITLSAGNIVRFESWCNRARGDRTFSNSMDTEYLVTRDYADFREFFEDVIFPSDSYDQFANGDVKMLYQPYPDNTSRTQIAFKADTSRDGKRNIRQQTNIYITKSSIPVFETIPLENDNNIYVETPKTYNVIAGQYQTEVHKLTDFFNCYCFGNGVESISVRDEMTTNFLNVDYAVNAVSEDVYRQVHRYADLTYSGVYQESTNVNRLNEFNLSLANYKDDLEKSFGPIMVLDSEATDLLVIQEDRFSKVLYGKDLLFNADATTNLSRIEDVLGQQVVYGGEYGISFQPDSYDSYATNAFNVDVKRGCVVRLNDSNGLMEISSNGMRDYFKTLFRDNTILNCIGQYDAFFDTYVLNIKYKTKGDVIEYVTWLYSPEAQGFLGKQTFNPDDMLRVNNHFLSFKGADVYKHNVGTYNTFYGSLNQCDFEFNFSQEPSTRKIFKNISIEGNSAWNIQLKTDLQNGYINYADFKNKEGVYYGYVRGNDALDTSTLAVSGIGEVLSIAGSIISFSNNISSLISVGDSVYNSSLSLLGTITDITSNSITVSDASLITIGMFLVSSKPSSVETSGIRGYYMNVKGSLTTPNYVEAYALNSEVSKSFE